MKGLDISIEQFKKMKSHDRDELMYKNLVHIRNKISYSRFHVKLQYAWLFVLTIAYGFKKYLGL